MEKEKLGKKKAVNEVRNKDEGQNDYAYQAKI